mmetsp:Transcript_27129/g.58112  ORF Transcript_27129/g.58112 Transcript_27129/m.58112 type:complete len:648 (+) Transcript_27129:150-2093(+)
MQYHTTLIALSLALAANAQETRRQRGLGTSQYESVSAEPLTFEVAEPEPTDRQRLLVEAEIANGTGDFDWMEDYEMEEFEDMGLVNMNEDFIDEDQDEDALYEDEEDAASEEPEDFADSTYVSENGVDFRSQEDEDQITEEGDEFEMTEHGAGEGYDDVGEGLEFNEPIARKLRRLDNPKIMQHQDEERYLAEKESFRDDSIPIFEPVLDENGEFEIEPEWDPEEDALLMGDQHNRDLQNGCNANQQRAKIQVITDNSGYETSWQVRRSNGALVTKGPRVNTKYADNKQYIGSICLSPGTYRFIVLDKFADGMCGSNTGRGLYRFYLNGAKKFTSPANCAVNWGKRVHTFTIRSASQPAPSPTPAAAISGRGGCQTVKVQFKVDKYAKETVVTLSGNGQTHLSSNKNVGAYQTKTMTKCLSPGTYTLRLVDKDGICCNNGKGWYKMFVNGQRVIGGGYFIGSKTHTIKIGSNWQASMGSRATQWLNAHNSRRRKYNGGAGYVALRWSRTLAADATNYANTLGNSCKNGRLSHAQGIQDGENLARNSGSGNWGSQYTADKIMGRWVENELSMKYPANAHLTQVVWRATQYVGCGEHVQNNGNGQLCRTQVCRYARAGNCNVRNGNWRSEAWKDDTGCGRSCPREGCFS